MPTEAQFSPPDDDPLRKVTPSVDDVEARRARAAIEGRLFSGPARRVKVGRYRVLDRIGSGGMGVVYKANDPELARDVAVKLMNTEAVSDDDADHARGRLVREARAMARLAHPNVIHVYDVGTVEDGVFIAMELVEGESLGAWVKAEPRPWKDVLARFIDAGRGLAAAHDAGVIHRDFKPENVLVGVDGRVRVGDFGLAGGPGSETGRHDPSPSESGQAEIDQSAVGEALTRTGALLGTPKYMAPEQEAGAPATARSDQFSFCVALYEALYGQAPYAGDSVVEYRINVREGVVRPPPANEAPQWIADALLRGLSAEPADRHQGMNELLDELATALVEPVVVAAPAKAKRPVLWFGAIAVLTGVAVATAFLVLQPEPPPSELVPVAADVPRPEQPAPAIPDAISKAPKEGKAEPSPPEPTPAVAAADVEKKAKVGTKSRPRRGVPCYFSERGKFLRSDKRELKHLVADDACYSACHLVRGNPNRFNPDVPGTECGPKYTCERDQSGEACEAG